jgi:hypothetical protein
MYNFHYVYKKFNMEFYASISILSPVHTQVERKTYTRSRRRASLLLFIQKRNHSDKCCTRIYTALFQYIHVRKQSKCQNSVSSDINVSPTFHVFTAIILVSLIAEYYKIYEVFCDL